MFQLFSEYFISLSVFSLTYSKSSVLLFHSNYFHWSFPWEVKKENHLLKDTHRQIIIFPKEFTYVRDPEYDCKYSVFYVLKSQFMPNINLNFFWSSNFLLVGGQLNGGRCIYLVVCWSAVGWLVGWLVGCRW